jgi:hypothetical protein
MKNGMTACKSLASGGLFLMADISPDMSASIPGSALAVSDRSRAKARGKEKSSPGLASRQPNAMLAKSAMMLRAAQWVAPRAFQQSPPPSRDGAQALS